MQLTTLFATVLSVASLVSAAALPPAVVEEDKALDKRRLHVFRDGHVTWYTGGQLANPACPGFHVTDDSFNIAVPYGSPIGDCGDEIHLHRHAGSPKVTVRIADRCEACPPHGIDATKAVFRALAPLSEGVLEGVHIVKLQ